MRYLNIENKSINSYIPFTIYKGLSLNDTLKYKTDIRMVYSSRLNVTKKLLIFDIELFRKKTTTIPEYRQTIINLVLPLLNPNESYKDIVKSTAAIIANSFTNEYQTISLENIEEEILYILNTNYEDIILQNSFINEE